MAYPPPHYPQQPQQPPYVPGPAQQFGPPPQAYGAPPAYPPQLPPPRRPQYSTGRKVLIVTLCLLALCGAGGLALLDNTSGNATVAPATTAKRAAAKNAAGTSGAKPKQPDTYNVPLGSTITITGDDGSSADGTLRSVKTYSKACDDFSPQPDNGVFLVVDVLVEQTKGTGSVNALDFTFVADDGTTANAASGLFSGCDNPSLDATNSLHAGQKRAGKVAFDATASKGTVEWAPGGLGADSVGSWKVG